MNNIFNPDFEDFIKLLNKNEIEYMLVGGYAVILHGYSRTTGDMDLWVKKDKANYAKIMKAFEEFGMPVFEMTEDNFLNNDSLDVFTFGRPPVSIDILNSVKGLKFEEAYKNSEIRNIEGLDIRLISLQDLLKAKKASARPRDINDIENLK